MATIYTRHLRESLDDEKFTGDTKEIESIEQNSTNSVDEDHANKSRRERALLRKLDKRILPIACLLYLFAYLDRTNLGNARLQGLPKDILHGDPSGKLFNWVNSAFFFSYILVQVPATIIARKFPPRYWIGSVAVGWGLCSTLLAATFNFSGIMVGRLALGFFEAGFGPGIPVYMALFYNKNEMGLRMAYWFGFAAVAGAFGGLVAFGVQHAHTAIANWRLLFIIEGLPTILLGLGAMWLLPERAEKESSRRFLTEDERELQLERMNRFSSGEAPTSVNKRHVLEALTDWKVYLGGVMYFAFNCALASISAFLPTILKTFGFTDANAQLLTVAPYACTAVVLVLVSYLSDRIQSRGIPIACCAAVSGMGYILLITVARVEVRYFATFCITSGTYTCIGLTIAWYTHNLGSENKKATGVPMFMAIGQCGSILGSHLFPSIEGPKYIKGFTVSCGLAFLASFTALVLTVYYRCENRRRIRQYGQAKDGRVDTSELADRAPGFRYVQ